MTRPDLEEYFLDIAKQVSKRSTCLRRKIGAVIVKDRFIIATGYNGVPTGIQHCSERGCVKDIKNIPSGSGADDCFAVHAEANAIIMAAHHGISIKNSILYCTNQPCFNCAKMIINAGIKKVISASDYPDTKTLGLLHQAGIEYSLWEGK